MLFYVIFSIQVQKVKERNDRDRMKTRQLAGKFIVNETIQEKRQREIDRRQLLREQNNSNAGSTKGEGGFGLDSGSIRMIEN